MVDKDDKKKIFNIKDELKKLPRRPGVYLMKNKTGKVLYVGKAVNLNSRVKSYFQKGDKTYRIERMVSLVHSFEYIAANDEREAFIIECNLIKSYMPRYNVMFKDDKTYPYIKITVKDEYPRISMTRRFENDGSRYFGPYPERVSAKKAIGILQMNFPIRTCQRKSFGNAKRPCLNYQIKRCLGPCANLCTREEYMEQVDGVIKFLEGKAPEILNELKNKMDDASRKHNYESAAVYRDKISTLRKASDMYMITPGMKRGDFMACSIEDGLSVVYILNIKNGSVVNRRQYEFDNSDNVDEKVLMKDFIRQYYANGNVIPDEIIVFNVVENSEWLGQWLSGLKGKKVEIRTPKKGGKKRLADMAYENARLVLKGYKERRNSDTANLIELAKLLELEQFPERIEAFDISNLAGKDTVGSMVVFLNGRPQKGMYRKFSIRNTNSYDDLKAMAEVIRRRLAKLKDGKFGAQPDIFLIDGGKNQVNVVIDEMKSAGIDIPVCGMVKDSKHITRALIYNGEEKNIKQDGSLFRFIAAIQNEAHRFAIEYNRKKRKKRYFDSELDNVKGVGIKRKENLMKHFGSVREIKAAGISQLEMVKSINKTVAEDVYGHFHGKVSK